MQNPYKVANQGDNHNQRPEWLYYPNNLRLASIPHKYPEPCPVCQAEQGERHKANCSQAVCPKCQGALVSCDCMRANNFQQFGSVSQIKRAINGLASLYIGQPTQVDFGTNDPNTLLQKYIAFDNLVALAMAAQDIFTGFTRGELKRLRDQGKTPRIAEQAIIMTNQARRIWLEWFWR